MGAFAYTRALTPVERIDDALRLQVDAWRDLQREVLADLDATGQAGGGR